MPVPYCHICEQNELEKRQYGDATLDQGDYCPVCHQPTCRFRPGGSDVGSGPAPVRGQGQDGTNAYKPCFYALAGIFTH